MKSGSFEQTASRGGDRLASDRYGASEKKSGIIDNYNMNYV
jgi:hypothetical protein